MGLFSKKIDTTQFDIYKTADFGDEKNDALLNVVEGYAKHPLYNDDGYYILNNFLINITSEDFANFFAAGSDHSKKDKDSIVCRIARYLKAWGVENAIDKNNTFRLALNNPSIKNLKKGTYVQYVDLDDLYDWYTKDYYNAEQAQDVDSIIFHPELSESHYIYELCEIDREMINDKIRREAILYNDEGKIRRYERIKEDYNRYLENGNLSEPLNL